MNRWLTNIFYIAFLTLSLASTNLGQKALVIKKDPPGAILIDEFGVMNSEIRSARFDVLFSELNAKPGSTGYVFLFCGKICHYGEIESHLRGIEVKVRSRTFERGRLIILNGGYRESFATEFWVVPAGASPPTPKSTLNIKDVTFKGSSKWAVQPYDCCDDQTELWNELKKH
jgi:hypothetical protein